MGDAAGMRRGCGARNHSEERGEGGRGDAAGMRRGCARDAWCPAGSCPAGSQGGLSAETEITE